MFYSLHAKYRWLQVYFRHGIGEHSIGKAETQPFSLYEYMHSRKNTGSYFITDQLQSQRDVSNGNDLECSGEARAGSQLAISWKSALANIFYNLKEGLDPSSHENTIKGKSFSSLKWHL